MPNPSKFEANTRIEQGCRGFGFFISFEFQNYETFLFVVLTARERNIWLFQHWLACSLCNSYGSALQWWLRVVYRRAFLSLQSKFCKDLRSDPLQIWTGPTSRIATPACRIFNASLNFTMARHFTAWRYAQARTRSCRPVSIWASIITLV